MAKKTQKFDINTREREIILFALEFFKSNLTDEAQEILADHFQAVSGPADDPHGAESVPSEVDEDEVDGLIRRIERYFGRGR